MYKRLAGGAIAAAAAAATIALTAPSALAATWTVSGNTNADGSITGTLSGGAVLTDVTTGQQVNCDTGSSAGTAANGTGLSGTPIGTISQSNFGSDASPCTGPLGSTFTASFTASADHPAWNLNADSYASGVTQGNMTGIYIETNGESILGPCVGSISGQLNSGAVSYDNASHTLKFADDSNPQLTIHVTDNTGCAGLFNEGDVATFSGNFVLDPPIQITSP